MSNYGAEVDPVYRVRATSVLYSFEKYTTSSQKVSGWGRGPGRKVRPRMLAVENNEAGEHRARLLFGCRSLGISRSSALEKSGVNTCRFSRYAPFSPPTSRGQRKFHATLSSADDWNVRECRGVAGGEIFFDVLVSTDWTAPDLGTRQVEVYG